MGVVIGIGVRVPGAWPSRGALSLAISLAALAVGPDLAEACSPDPCGHAGFAPADGTRIPANAPAFFLSSASASKPDNVTLSDAAGAALATSLSFEPDGILVVPRLPIAPGGYLLSARQAPCPTGIESRFEVMAAEPWPDAFGTVGVRRAERRTITISAGASCTRTVATAVVVLDLAVAPKMTPFLPVARYTLTVDGEVWLRTPYGARGVWVPGANVRSVDQIYSLCDAGPYGASWQSGVGPGWHRGELKVEIAGAPRPLPPIAFGFEMRCPWAAADVADGGSAAGEGGAGCSYAGPHARSSPAFVVPLALVLWSARCRRPVVGRGDWLDRRLRAEPGGPLFEATSVGRAARRVGIGPARSSRSRGRR